MVETESTFFISNEEIFEMLERKLYPKKINLVSFRLSAEGARGFFQK